MKKSLLLRLVLVIVAFVGFTIGANAQVTSSSMTGTIKDAKGALPGASVKATHTPTGTVYSVSTNNDGRFTIANMRVGGPYTVEVSFIGYNPEKITDLALKLGDPYVLNVVLSDNSKQLNEIVITGKNDPVFNSKKTGASTNISKEQIQNLPSLSRSLTDFTRLTPQANGNSFAGANNRFNNISIDGAVNNDVFGLAGNGAPGGQAGTQPISLDAIQELQVVLAPFDVTLGNFAGGGVNAITRSGTNKVEGSAYFFGRNQNTVGKSVDGLNTKAAKFYDAQYGFRLGAPIIKNKLFFFVNAEMGRRQEPTSLNVGDPGSVLSLTDAQSIANTLQTRYGYDAGSYDAVNRQTQNNKIFARLDWNINAKNQLTLRHNYIDAFDDNISRSTTQFRFGNNAYKFNNTQNVSVLELRSAISQTVSNNLIVGYQRIRDYRSTAGSLFPQIQINNMNGVSGNSVLVGSERSSTANELDQDIIEFTDNVKIFANKHTFTFGTHNEFFKFRNLFMNNFAGSYTYSNLNDFTTNAKPNVAAATYSIVPGEASPSAKFSAAQLGFYFQDEIDAFKGFKLIAGLRVDVPLFFDDPAANPLIPTSFPNQRTDQTPSGQILVSPRLSFNWDLTGDRSLQLRGGAGLLTSRAPFVWLSNQFTNSGMLYGAVNATNGTGTFIADPANQKAAGGSVPTYEVNLVNNNFKVPQVFRTNVAVDFKLPGGITGTLEALLSKTVNNVLYKNINMKPAIGRINSSITGGADTRPLYNYPTTAGKVNTTFTNVYYLDNTDKGSTYNLTAQLQKSFNFGLFLSGSYTYGKSKDINSGASSTASSNFGFVQIVNDPNNPDLAYSNFDVRHRVTGALNYAVKYGKNKEFGTTFSLFYVGKSGSPFTYLYFGDLNQDGNNQNDLLYVPRNLSEIKLADLNIGTTAAPVIIPIAQQWAALDAFINSDPYLSTKRGQYTERNGARMPWEHQFDVRIMQDLGIVGGKGTKNSLQLSLDIINVGNLINKDWGKLYSLSNTASTLINYNYNATTGGNYTFRAPTNGTAYQVAPFASRWQAQVGVRYNFN
ncbi:hypothetical protein QF042_003655 [Pedobacter sp. W3I1]|uniref:TonB-dependent receptor n=1 Tax=Pedobacter sp. W3I1 TaxID=3042291 RepID=UPI00278219CA|nr:TonB-dependent receptor [Pedobacter sp. W3I1]MDQ0640090.1 hypothetical protein [Pedobacter sp. W3I1]